jgi:RNA polymerase sigma factor (sigma-70 family)
MVSHQSHRLAKRPTRRHRAGPRPTCPPTRADGPDGFDLGAVLPLVRNEVGRFRPWRVGRDDLMQAGVAGALEAWRRRDPALAAALRTYTTTWVRKELRQTVARGDFTVAVPPHVPPQAVALRRHLDRGLALGSASRHLGLTDEQTLSLDRLLEATPDGGETFDITRLRSPDTLVEDAVLARLDCDAVRRAVAGLKEPQRSVIVLHFGFDGAGGRSTREIGRLVGVSDFTVRAQLKQATAVLRARLGALRTTDARER